MVQRWKRIKEEYEEKQKKIGVGDSLLHTMGLQSNSWNHIKNIRHEKTNRVDKYN
jgi:hypothetical protein